MFWDDRGLFERGRLKRFYPRNERVDLVDLQSSVRKLTMQIVASKVTASRSERKVGQP